jgi:uncharacterized SAM-binding protein YcdF (DUF218 family)
MNHAWAIVIFGAAVRPDGRPSPALARRIGYGRQAAAAWPEAPVLCSGAVGRAGPSEASVMAVRLLEQGVSADRIALDEVSRDTLQSTVAAAQFVRRHGLAGCVVCSDGYHTPRIRMLLGLLGVRTVSLRPGRGRGGAGRRQWLRMAVREAFAIPYDLAVVLFRRAELLAQIAG